MTTSVGILQTWSEPPEVAEVFGHPWQSICKYFMGEKDLSFVTFAVSDGQPLPGLRECDAYIITGSEHSVYEPLSWIAPLTSFAKNAIEQDRRIFGICFGHQIMTLAQGGTVEKSPKGRGIGLHTHKLTEEGNRIFPGLGSIRIMAAHQDQVIKPPPGARLLASSSFCEHAAFAYGSSGLSVQGHPEISEIFERQIIEGWQARDPVAEHIVREALKSFETVECNTRQLRPALAQFLTGNLALG